MGFGQDINRDKFFPNIHRFKKPKGSLGVYADISINTSKKKPTLLWALKTEEIARIVGQGD
jgi:hypothetical protein